MNFLFYESLIAFFVFALIRYAIPNFILGKESTLWSGFVLSSFYTLSVFLRSYSKQVFLTFPQLKKLLNNK